MNEDSGVKKTWQNWKKKSEEISSGLNFDREKYKNKLKSNLIKLKEILKQETDETKKMIEIYQKYTQGLATTEEMNEANQQFRDVLKGLGLGIVIVLPFSPITIPLIVKLGQRLGVDIFPSSVSDQRARDEKENKT